MKKAQSAGHTLPLVARAFSHKSHAVHFSLRKQKTRCIFILFFIYSINGAFRFFSFFVRSRFDKTHCFDNISLHLRIFYFKLLLSNSILKSLFVQRIFSKKRVRLYSLQFILAKKKYLSARSRIFVFLP